MRLNGIYAKTVKRFKVTTNSKHKYPVAANILNRQFSAEKPNQIWVSDITYIHTKEGFLYLAAIMDLYSRKIVGWAMDRMINTQLVKDALSQAKMRRNPPRGVIVHSDQGIQYASPAYQSLLKEYHFVPSMSRRGNCYDNACMESFFHTLKTELIYFNKYQTRSEAKQSIFEYIEVFYNRKRLHSSLSYKSPYDFEKRSSIA
jgi:transposase InsO family protein